MEIKITLTAKELRQMLMSAWVDAWMFHKTDTTDDGKREYANTVIDQLIYAK